jgi:hypothetical protein
VYLSIFLVECGFFRLVDLFPSLEDKTRQIKTRQDKTRQDSTVQRNTRYGKARQGKAIQHNTTQHNTTQHNHNHMTIMRQAKTKKKQDLGAERF